MIRLAEYAIENIALTNQMRLGTSKMDITLTRDTIPLKEKPYVI